MSSALNELQGDFDNALKIVQEAVGLQQSTVQTGSNSITAQMPLMNSKPHPQEHLAGIVDQLGRHFQNVTIAQVHYKVPRTSYESSGLPQDKLTYRLAA